MLNGSVYSNEPISFQASTDCATVKTEIALAEAHAKFTRYEIDLFNKPEWYAPQVNPASKVIPSFRMLIEL